MYSPRFATLLLFYGVFLSSYLFACRSRVGVFAGQKSIAPGSAQRADKKLASEDPEKLLEDKNDLRKVLSIIGEKFDGTDDFVSDIFCKDLPTKKFVSLPHDRFKFYAENVNKPFNELTIADQQALENVQILAEASFLTYKRSAYIIEAAKRWGFDKVTAVSDATTDAQAFLMSNAESVVVVFRGTSSKSDWWLNLQVAQLNYLAWGNIHAGFGWGYQGGAFSKKGDGIQNELFSALSDHGYDVNLWRPMPQGPSVAQATSAAMESDVAPMKKPTKKLYVTGHSAGGALAQIFTADLIQRELYYKHKAAQADSANDDSLLEEHMCTGSIQSEYVENVIVFGSPRFASLSFAKCYEVAFPGRVWRVNLNNDVVAQIPPAALGFQHVGENFYISQDHKVLVNPKAGTLIQDRLAGIFESLIRGDIGAVADGLRDHMSYVNAINHQLNASCSPVRTLPVK